MHTCWTRQLHPIVAFKKLCQQLGAAELLRAFLRWLPLAVGRQEKQSHVEKATLSPTWNEELEFTGKLQDLVAHGLLMIVMDWDRGMRDDELGAKLWQVSERLAEVRFSGRES